DVPPGMGAERDRDRRQANAGDFVAVAVDGADTRAVPYLWGLGAFGQPGVKRVLEISICDVIVGPPRRARFAVDSPLEGAGFEPPVPPAGGAAARSRGTRESASPEQDSSREGPRVRTRFPPVASHKEPHLTRCRSGVTSAQRRNPSISARTRPIAKPRQERRCRGDVYPRGVSLSAADRLSSNLR